MCMYMIVCKNKFCPCRCDTGTNLLSVDTPKQHYPSLYQYLITAVINRLMDESQ